MQREQLKWAVFAGWSLMFLGIQVCPAVDTQSSTLSATDLVRLVVSNEVAAGEINGHFRYSILEETARGSETRDTIETRNWAISRVVLENGKPLSRERLKE